jgi:L-asparaginase / beta-aspartyl-peptidase
MTITRTMLLSAGVIVSITGMIVLPVVFSGLQAGGSTSYEAVFGIVVHGGAGAITRTSPPTERELARREALREAIETGHRILKEGGGSLDAVEAAVRLLEDSPLFNAGKGAVFSSDGANELDASIMDGQTLKAGAVAAVKHIKNPVTLARLVMDKSPHVLLAGEGAEKFALEQNIPLIDQTYFFTEEQWQQLQRIKDQEKKAPRGDGQLPLAIDKYGTVGAVALDKAGNLAAATSTGGTVNKRFGRIGDTPVIGAGNYANNQSCAVSATGHGEFFLRMAVAYDIAALMEYKGLTIEQAAHTVVKEKLLQAGGTGGVIAIDRKGNMAMPFNTSGMYRGYARGWQGKAVVEVF